MKFRFVSVCFFPKQFSSSPVSQVPKFPIYTVYCNNFDGALRTLAAQEKKKKEFKDFMDVGPCSFFCFGALVETLCLLVVIRKPPQTPNVAT